MALLHPRITWEILVSDQGALLYVDLHSCISNPDTALFVCESLFFRSESLFHSQKTSNLLKKLCRSLKKHDWAKSDGIVSLLGIKKGKGVKSCQKHTKNMNLVEPQEWFAHKHSFVKSDSLTFTLFKIATRAICSQLIFLTLIYAADGLYDTHSLNGFFS